MKKNAAILSVAIFCLLISAGCATKEAVKNVSDEETLKERAMTYWNHKIKGEFDKSYEYEDPFYRKTQTMVDYIKNIGGAVKWKDMKISAVRMDGNIARIVLKLKILLNFPQAIGAVIESTVIDKWVKAEGQWYRVQPKPGLPEK